MKNFEENAFINLFSRLSIQNPKFELQFNDFARSRQDVWRIRIELLITLSAGASRPQYEMRRRRSKAFGAVLRKHRPDLWSICNESEWIGVLIQISIGDERRNRNVTRQNNAERDSLRARTKHGRAKQAKDELG